MAKKDSAMTKAGKDAADRQRDEQENAPPLFPEFTEDPVGVGAHETEKAQVNQDPDQLARKTAAKDKPSK
jgi:hypothetical protein